jgi:hypothetical protein
MQTGWEKAYCTLSIASLYERKTRIEGYGPPSSTLDWRRSAREIDMIARRVVISGLDIASLVEEPSFDSFSKNSSIAGA